MPLRVLLLLLAALATFLYLRGPSAARIVDDTVIAAEAGSLRYRDVRYDAEWGPRVTHSGDIRLIDRAKYKPAPFFTHHAVLTTDEFSDPEVVRIGDSGGGNFYWTAKKEPLGTLVVLHFVPKDALVLRALEGLDEGDAVSLTGREEVDGRVEGSNGSTLALRHDNHKYLLLEEVRSFDN